MLDDGAASGPESILAYLEYDAVGLSWGRSLLGVLLNPLMAS